MASGRLLIPGWMPARDSNGDPIPNVRAFFYVDGTTTLATVYADVALTVPLMNPVVANSSGRFPQIYASDAVLYSASVDAPYGPPGLPFTFEALAVSISANIAAANLAQGSAEDAELALQDVQDAIDAATQAGGGEAAVAGALAGQAAATAAVPGLITGKADTTGDNLNATDKEDFIGNLQVTKGGFWTDQAPGAVVWRAQDRFLFGDGVQYTGGRFGTGAGLGTDWLTTRGANYFAKNAQVMGLSTNRIGGLFGSWTPTGVGSLVNMGVGAVSLNEGTGSTGRALYAEALHYSANGVTVGLEIQGGNFTNVMPTPSAYGLGFGYHGMQIGVQSGVGYVLGNDNTPIPVPTMPSGVAIDISGGEQNLAVQRWTCGITFRNGGLFRGVDGLTGTAKAISMAQRHEIVWEVSATQRGATIRSDVTGGDATAGGIIFADNITTIVGASEAPVFRARQFTSAVNFMEARNSTTGNAPSLNFDGTDTNVNGFLQAKGAGILSLRTQGGTSEGFRVSGPATAVATNYLNAAAVGTGASPSLSAAGTDANVGMDIRTKATGTLRLLSGDGTAKVSANNTGLSFYGGSPVAKATLAAAATDAATTQTLVNDIRAKLIALGLFS